MIKRVRPLIIALMLTAGRAVFASSGVDEDALKEIYLRAFNLFQQAGGEQRAGNARLAREQYSGVIELLDQIRRENPSWQKSIVDYLKTESENALKGMQEYKTTAPPVFSETGFREIAPQVDLSRLESEIAKYQSLITQQEMKLNELLGESDQARQDYETARGRLEREKESLLAELNQTRQRLSQSELDRNKELAAREAAEQEAKNAEQRHQRELARVRLQLEKEKAALEIENKTNLEKRRETEKELTRLKGESAQTRSALEKSLAEKEKEAAFHKDLSAAALKERDVLREKVAQISLLLQEKEAQTAELARQLSKTQDELKIARRDAEKESLLVKSVQKEKEEALARLAKIQEGYDKLVADYQSRNADFDGRMKELETEKLAAAQEITRLNLALDAAQREKAAAIEREQSAAGEIARLKNEVKEASDKNRLAAEKKGREKKLVADLEEERRLRLAAEKSLREKEEAIIEAASQKDAAIKPIEARLSAVVAEKEAVEQKLVAVSQRYDGMMKELNASFDNVKSALEAKLASAQKGVEEQAQTIRDKEAQLQNLMVDYKKKYQTAMLNLQKNYEDQLAKLNEKIRTLESSEKAARVSIPAPKTAEEQARERREREELVQKVTEAKTAEPKPAARESKVGLPVYDRQAILFYNQGVDLAEKGQIEQAQAEFKKAIDIFPHFFEAHYNLGRTYVMQGKKKEAVDEYNRALGIREDADVYYGLGAIYWEMGQWPKVIENWEQAIKISPDHPLANQWLPKAREKVQSAAVR